MKRNDSKKLTMASRQYAAYLAAEILLNYDPNIPLPLQVVRHRKALPVSFLYHFFTNCTEKPSKFLSKIKKIYHLVTIFLFADGKVLQIYPTAIAYP